MNSRNGWLILAVMLAGCATQPPLPTQPRVARPEPQAARASADEVIDLSGNGDADAAEPVEDSLPGTGRFAAAQSADNAGPRASRVEGEASFNFEAASIPEVVKAVLGEFLQENYVIAPGVAGQVTFSTTQPVAAEQAMGILEMLLAMNNYALVWREGKYLILPATEAPRGNVAPRTDGQPFGPGFQVRAVPLKYMAAAEVEKLLQPFARPGAVLKADNARSMVLLAGTAGDLQNYIDTIRTFDVDWMAGMSFGLYTLERVEVKDLVPELEAIFADPNSPLAGLIKLMPIERLNGVLVITPQRQYLREVERWIRRLDKGGSEAGARLYVYEVRNVKAIDLADRLNEIFTGQAAPQRSTSATGQVAPGLTPTEITSSSGRPVTSRNQPVPPLQTSPTPTDNNSTGLAALEGADVRITAVEENNALLIRATPSQYDVIRSAIKRLDLQPLQVHIEAKVLEVTLNDALQYGVSSYFETALSELTPPVDDDDDEDDTSAVRSALKALQVGDRYGRVRSSGVQWIFAGSRAGALVDLLQTVSDTKVLSAPSLMVLNNKEASINVGQQIPVNSLSVNNGGVVGQPGTGFQTNSYVQFRDTGITLSVTPRVNPGGLVYMEIDQEQSTPGAEVAGNLIVNQKTITTEIAVQSGDTVLLGGLIQQTDRKSTGGVPYLSRIPVIGGIFGNRSRNSDRTELLVLITPTVVDGNDTKLVDLTEEYKARFQGLEPLIREEARAMEAARVLNEQRINQEQPE